MYPLMIRRISVVTTTPLKSLGSFSLTPLKFLRFLSSSSEIKENPVTAFFENHGFSNSQISLIFKKLPRLLSAKPEKSLLPKLLFLQSKGLSSPEVTNLLTAYPFILTRSLHKHIIPTFDYIHDKLLSEETTSLAMKRFAVLLRCDLQNSIRPNIEILTKLGVPYSNMESILRLHPRVLSFKPFRFKEVVEEVKEMGFNPRRLTFVLAVYALRSMSKSTWKKKMEVYRKWGCSEEQVLSGFGRHPVCMMASEDKINGVMDYFVNKIGCESSFITTFPTLLCYSLKRRIVPRGSVFLVLSSEGLIKKDVKLGLFSVKEKSFVDSFIKPHEKHIPGLLKLYKEELEVDTLSIVNPEGSSASSL